MRKIFTYIIYLIAVIIVFSISVILIGFYLSPQDSLRKVDAIVVVSGGETNTRTLRGIELYQQDYAPLLIFSGDALDPNSISNAAAMKQFAIDEYSVPENDIIIEENSLSTYQNAINLKPVFEQNEIKNIILVTSPYHQRRTAMTFQFVMGKDFSIINQSSTDEFWRKIAWWQNDRALFLTFSELWKIIYINITNEYQ